MWQIKSIEDLNNLDREAWEASRDIHAHQRSNVQLVVGDHYKKNQTYYSKLLRYENVAKKQRLRLTQNHIYKIANDYVNNILTYAPAVSISARNESEIQDQKKAELHSSVWQFQKDEMDIDVVFEEAINDFIKVGEVWLKAYHDPNAGKVIREVPVLDEEGMPVTEDGEILTERVFEGKLKFERYPGYNVKVDPNCESYKDAGYVVLEKIFNKKTLLARYDGDDDKRKFIEGAGLTESYNIYQSSSRTYSKSDKNTVVVREFYFRPCQEFPYGYYFYATTTGILEEGELPFGIWPLIHIGMDEISDSPRSHSIIKQLRPFQAEINRCFSSIAETQVTLGRDKIITQMGATLSAGISGDGFQHLTTNGPAPSVIPGRSGEQYIVHAEKQIEGMYRIANLLEDQQEKQENNVDAYAMLFRSLRQRKKFSIYANKAMRLRREMCKKTLELCKAYLNEETIIPIVGRNEIVNIQEFKSMDDLCYEIRIEDTTEDAESKMGRQLTLNNIMQYAGKHLTPDMIGQIAKNMPYINDKQMFNDLTIDYENIVNTILRMDRGQFVPPKPKDNHEYIMKKLDNRMKQPDFDFLPPQVQQMYQQKYQAHEQAIMQAKQEALQLQAGFIPTGGHLVSCDFYVEKPGDPTKTRRLRIPADALNWLVETLKTQGSTTEMLAPLNSQFASINEMPEQQRQQLIEQIQAMQAQQQPNLEVVR